MRTLNGGLLWLGAWVTQAVGTMWCAVLFLLIAVIATPGVFPPGWTAVAQWTAQDLLQLVLLSIIMVGQRIQGDRTEVRDQETHDAVMLELAELRCLSADIHRTVKETP